MIKSDIISFRPTRKEDLEFVLAAEADQENNPYIISWTREEHLAAFSNGDLLHLMIESLQDCKPVGFIIIAGRENTHQSIELKRIIITQKGQGRGKETLRLVKKLAFEQLKAHRLWLDVKDNNKRAKYLYHSQGFIEEGILRECLKVGNEFQSLVVMSILAREYFSK